MKKQRALAAVAVLSVLLVGAAKSPESIVRNFYQALAKGEITQARGYLSAQAGREGEGALSAALSSASEHITDCGGIKNMEIRLQNTGEVSAAIMYVGKCEMDIRYHKLIKEDGKWKIR
jgi:Domain of unknown function (DUF4878)